MLKGGRRSGVLLHPTSLPGGQGIGDVGAEARRFVDWLAAAGQAYWQLLPLVATDGGGSPYNGLSAMAGNAWLIDVAALADEGLVDPGSLRDAPASPGRVDYAAVGAWKEQRLREAHAAFRDGAAPHLRAEMERYRERNAGWLDDYALFRALRDLHAGALWTEWEPPLRDRAPAALRAAREELADDVGRHRLEQLLFDRQWAELRAYAARRGVRLIGDIPIFVAHDSADVWAHRGLFQLDDRGSARVVSGVPPDYFSETGQRWGNPLYHWPRMRELGFPWWTERFRRTLEWVDLVRVDHFRGFEAYWEIPAEEETAVRGRWRPGPGREIFDAVAAALGDVPVIAEDLGLITAEVEALRDELGLPGMRVLQFAFDGDPRNPHLPENHPVLSVSYTGTHDNDTSLGWWRSAPPEVRAQVAARLPRAPEPAETDDGVHWSLIRLALASPARLAVVPVQDVLGAGSEARMNTPGTASGNWAWRLGPDDLTPGLAARLRAETRASGRMPAHPTPEGESR